jgi:hypothetical protein
MLAVLLQAVALPSLFAGLSELTGRRKGRMAVIDNISVY